MAFWSNPSELLPKQSHRWVVSFNTQFPEVNSSGKRGDERLPHYFAKSVERPSYDVGVVQAKYLYSHTFNFPKRITWKPIKIEFNDVFINSNNELYSVNTDGTIEGYNNKKKYNVSTQLFFYNLLVKSGYYAIKEDNRKDQSLSYNAYTFKNNLLKSFTGYDVDLLEKDPTNTLTSWRMYITELDGDGKALEAWEINNPLVTNVSFGKLDYSSDGILSITADISYDWAELKPREVSKVSKKEPTMESANSISKGGTLVATMTGGNTPTPS